MSEGTYLDQILAAKRDALARQGRRNLRDSELEALVTEMGPCRDFAGALMRAPKPGVIAEFKRKSPSEGELRADADPRHVAALYVDAGAACISVLCDVHFDGSLEDLETVRRSVSVPLLAKDFILTKGQIVDARAAGADAVLLIVAALEAPLLRELVVFATDLGLGVLCEAHTEREVERALASGATIIGVNARDLKTFEVDLDRTIALRRSVPQNGRYCYVAESGIKTREHVHRLREAQVDGVLVGSALMRADDPGLALTDLLAMP